MNKIEPILNKHNLKQYFEFINNNFVFAPDKLPLFENNFPEYMQYINGNQIEIKTNFDLVSERFPFVGGVNQDIISNVIFRNEAIKNSVKTSIINRSAADLKFISKGIEEQNFHDVSKRIIKQLNSFIYKYKINQFWVDTLLINDYEREPYLINIEILCSNGREFYLCLLKFSKSPYTQKYLYEIELMKNTLSRILKIKINKVLLINTMAEQSVMEI